MMKRLASSLLLTIIALALLFLAADSYRRFGWRGVLDVGVPASLVFGTAAAVYFAVQRMTKT